MEPWILRPIWQWVDDFSLLEGESLHVFVCAEGESHPQAEAAAQQYGALRPQTLYRLNRTTAVLLLSQTPPPSLNKGKVGAAHQAAHWGALVSFALLGDPASSFILSLSSSLALQGDDFLVGFLQRSVKKSPQLKKVFLQDAPFLPQDYQRASILSEAMCLTRSLIGMPANVLHPESYASSLRQWLGHPSVDLEVWDEPQLRAEGLGLLCAVGQGSSCPPRLVKLSYTPSSEQGHVVLVGKGVTFDSGGYNIKPTSGMRYMKKDMGGSAAVCGIFFACVRLGLPLRMTCYLPLAENMVSGKAMRPGDVYTARNGLSVEIDNTDAEGRLILGDALSLASEEKCDWLIDLATLTGAARVALGPSVDALFGNDLALVRLVEDLSQETGDWVWPLPLVESYKPLLDSSVADCVNSPTTSQGGTITAALFLENFVGNCPWTHIDTYMWCDKAQGMWTEGPTAKCVRLMVRALEEFAARRAK